MLALVPFLVRFSYLWPFRYRDSLGRPPMYQKTKQILTAVVIGTVVVSSILLIVNGRWLLAIILIVGCLLVEHFEKFHAYQRAVKRTSSHLQGTERQRDEIAMGFVDAQIDNGTLM